MARDVLTSYTGPTNVPIGAANAQVVADGEPIRVGLIIVNQTSSSQVDQIVFETADGTEELWRIVPVQMRASTSHKDRPFICKIPFLAAKGLRYYATGGTAGDMNCSIFYREGV
jgi:hypothetical protein